jgi:hypothetical protein
MDELASATNKAPRYSKVFRDPFTGGKMKIPQTNRFYEQESSNFSKTKKVR